MFPAKEESSEQFIKKIIGLSISMFGVILYTYFEMTNKKENPPSSLPASTSGKVREDEEALFENADDNDNDKE